MVASSARVGGAPRPAGAWPLGALVTATVEEVEGASATSDGAVVLDADAAGGAVAAAGGLVTGALRDCVAGGRLAACAGVAGGQTWLKVTAGGRVP